MTTVCVASGKGGAGKTSFTAALASTLAAGFSAAAASVPYPDPPSEPVPGHSASSASSPIGGQDMRCIFADCDVDAANGAIALGAIQQVSEPYFAGPGFFIDPSACNGCGRCFTSCRFGAIKPVGGKKEFTIIPQLCERCGACVDHCPTRAIGTYEKQAGVLLESSTNRGIWLVHAKLEPGEDTSGKLVNLVRRRAARLASADSVILVDAPPGIGCPVIASLAGSDLVVVVVEASASGIRDASRLITLAASMKRHRVAVLNKTGLDEAMDKKARSMLASYGIPLAGEIPFDLRLRSAEETGQTWASVDGESSHRVMAAIYAINSITASISHKDCKEHKNLPPKVSEQTEAHHDKGDTRKKETL